MMKRALHALLAFHLMLCIGCAQDRAAKRPGRMQPSSGGLDRPGPASSSPQPKVKAAPRSAPPCSLPALGPVPPEPQFKWVAQGCPPQFIACFTGTNGKALRDYITEMQKWANEARTRCNRGR